MDTLSFKLSVFLGSENFKLFRIFFSLLLPLTAVAGGPEVYLAKIPVEIPEGHRFADSTELVVALHSTDPFELLKMNPVFSAERSQKGSVVVRLQENPDYHGRFELKSRPNTFLVDYQSPIFQTLKFQVQARKGQRPTPEAIEEYVFRYVEEKRSLSHLSPASEIAKSKRGDCKQHAVLTAALLRLFGYDGRIVLGTIIHRNDSKKVFNAFGHAWNEVVAGNQRRVLDATRPAKEHAPEDTYYYIKYGELVDESEAYVLSFWGLLNKGVTKVSVLP